MRHAQEMQHTNPLETKTLGEFCQAIRQRENITQDDLAKMLGVSRNTVTRTEMGMVERPYQHLRFIKQWMNKREISHLLDLLRLIDIKHLEDISPTRDRGSASLD